MSVVYRAHDLRLKRKVALKLLAPELAEDERFRERFLRESQLAASLDHPNVVPVYEAGELEGLLYIAMRYVPGTDLKALLRAEGALAADRALAFVTQVGNALDAAHERGLVHRDVKPSKHSPHGPSGQRTLLPRRLRAQHERLGSQCRRRSAPRRRNDRLRGAGADPGRRDRRPRRRVLARLSALRVSDRRRALPAAERRRRDLRPSRRGRAESQRTGGRAECGA